MGTRPRTRPASDAQFNLYPPDSSDRIRIIRKVSAAEAAKQICLGVWEEREERDGFPCFHILASTWDDSDLDSGRSSVSISELEMDINAGTKFKYGKSHTLGMNEVKRMTRPKDAKGRSRPPEDRVERVMAKVRVWPDVEARAIDILRVWPK